MIPQAIRHLARLVLIAAVICLAGAGTVSADPPRTVAGQVTVLEALAAKAEAIRPKIETASGEDAKLVQVRAELDQLQKSVLEVAVADRPRLAEINKRLTDLGPVPAGDGDESPAVTAERKQLAAEKAAINLLLGETEDLSVSIGRMIEDIGQRRRDLFAADLTKRQDIRSVFGSETLGAAQTEFATLNRIVKSWFTFVTRFKLQSMLGAAFFALLSAAIMFIGGRRAFGDFYTPDPTAENPSYLSRLSVAFWSTLLPAATFAVFLGVTYLLFDYFKVLRTDIRELMYSAFSMAAMVFFIHRLGRAVLAPSLPEWRLVNVESTPARLLSALFTATAFVTGLDGFLNVVNETLGSPLSLTIAKSLFSTVLVGLLVLAISLIRPSGKSVIKSPFDNGFRTVLFLLALLPLIAAFLGYIGLARFASQQIVITGAVLITMYLGFKSAQSIQAEGAFATSGIGQFFGKRFEFGDVALDRIGVLVSLLINLFVLLIGVPLILLQWRFQWEDISGWFYKALNGFTVGSVTISLVGILTGLVAFMVVLALTRWFQRWLDGNILSRGKIDSGVRHSIRTAFGYAGMAIAALIGISAAGIDLSSLALVAGALSLGIGFGLQNIVSNFVSGLILLAERPFKVGDWIVAGTAEGIVKKISVRATEIETFHKQTMILPNSELINAAVGNWTHRNKLGRVDIPISVAYNTEPVKVQELLLEIARANPYVLKTPEPFVLFRAFGASSLDFDLRVHLADITQSPLVQNDVRFTVIRRFKEEGIEIPYPKTDINITRLVRPHEEHEAKPDDAATKSKAGKAKPVKG
ncbi:MAG: mechanosensitive ion channel domain-containing protein [Rhizobiaceae bacterium]